ncbi:MAG: hypothetical protein ACYC5V_08065 [Gemmatimonadaceae bacterium]
MKTPIKFSLMGGITLLLLPGVAAAQSVDARWQAWIGCWAPEVAAGTSTRAPGTSVRVCIAPAPGKSAVEVTTINFGKVTDRSVIEADAEPHRVTRDGCEGTETARWSQTGRQLLQSSALTCADGTRRASSGVLSFTEQGQWLDVRGLALNGASSGVTISRFVAADAADSASIPADVRQAMPVRTPAAEYAAVAASSPLSLADIAAVSTEVEAVVASAWLVERARGLTLAIDGKKLTALADNGVPTAVIDVAVALAYPDVFSLVSDSREAQRRPGLHALASQSPNRGGYQGMSTYGSPCDPYLWSLDPWYYYSRSGARCGYGNPFSYYGYGYPYGYYGYGYPYGGYGAYGGSYYSNGPAVIVIRNDGETRPSHGRVVKGQGYTSGAGASGPVARDGGSYTPARSGGSSMSAGGSSSSSSSGTSSSSGSSGGERTAVRKP